MKHELTVPPHASGERLDRFLTSALPDLTRSQIAKRLKAGGATVNGKETSVHRFLQAGDVVVFDEEARSEAVKKQDIKIANVPPLKIIEETKDWIVIDKPAGLLVHPDANHPTGTLVDALVAHDKKIAKIGEDPSRPGIMHRIDREVSGLMVIAKTQDAYDSLKKQFAEHSVDKRYHALVHGFVKEDEGDIKFRIARSKSKSRMAARPEGEEEGKAAWTHYKTLKRFAAASLLELNILSGRTHQIRAHLLAFNHPVMGDPLYGRKDDDKRHKPPRLMLQSVHLEFKDPSTGDTRSFDLPPDPAFDELAKRLTPASTV